MRVQVLDQMRIHISKSNHVNGRVRAPSPYGMPPAAQAARREPAFNVEHSKVSEIRCVSHRNNH